MHASPQFLCWFYSRPRRRLRKKVNLDWDRGTDFSKFHPYVWQASPDPAKGLWPQRVIDGVNTQLQAKGFKLVDSNPDLWVIYTSHIHKDQQVVGTGYTMGPGWGWGLVGRSYHHHLQHLYL